MPSHQPSFFQKNFVKFLSSALLRPTLFCLALPCWTPHNLEAKKSSPTSPRVSAHSRYAALGTKVNWRSGPGPDHDVLWCYESPGWPVMVMKKYDNWYYVKDFLNTSGWVKGSMLRFKPTLFVKCATHLYAAPDKTSRKKAKLQRGVIVRYVKHNDPLWLHVMIPEKNLQGWISSDTCWPNISAP